MSKYVLDYFSSDELRALGLVHFFNCKPLYVLADLFFAFEAKYWILTSMLF